MAPRVDSELLLVGSLPADSAEAALRNAAAFYRRTRVRVAGRGNRSPFGLGWL